MWRRYISWMLIFFGVVLVVLAGWQLYSQRAQVGFLNPLSKKNDQEEKFYIDASHLSFGSLQRYVPQASTIHLEQVLEQDDQIHSYLFSYTSEGKKVTGQINIPQEATPSAGFPVVVMLRGFVDPAIYTTGVGTKNAARVFAENGYVTIAPDFLGYGGSDAPDINPIIARLQRPLNVVDLIASLNSLEYVDPTRLGMWGHSNGGQIALSVLEITGRVIPTILWAPVSKSFPYSILYYTDESEDQGKALRKVLADFEASNDVYDYSIDRYWDWIKAPVQIHQGGLDDAIPIEWSQELAENLRRVGLEIMLHEYPQADHNLRPDWNTVVNRDISFFNQHLKNINGE